MYYLGEFKCIVQVCNNKQCHVDCIVVDRANGHIKGTLKTSVHNLCNIFLIKYMKISRQQNAWYIAAMKHK